MNVDVRIAEEDAILFEHRLYPIHNVKIYRPIIFVFTPSSGGVQNIVISEFLNVCRRCFTFFLENQWMRIDQLQQNGLYLLHVVIVGDRQQKFESACGRAGIIDDAVGGDFSIGDLDELFVGGVQLGVEEPDLAYGSRLTARLDVITDLEGVVGDDLQSAEYVVQEVLNCQGKGNTNNRERGYQWRNRNAEAAQNNNNGCEQEENFEDDS